MKNIQSSMHLISQKAYDFIAENCKALSVVMIFLVVYCYFLGIHTTLFREGTNNLLLVLTFFKYHSLILIFAPFFKAIASLDNTLFIITPLNIITIYLIGKLFNDIIFFLHNFRK